MTDRQELAGIARAARRYLERERAAGAGELLADGTGKAMASARAFSGAAAARKENVVSSAKAPIEATGFSGTTAPVRPEPVSATSAIDLPATAKNLFGEDEPVAPSPKPAAAALMEATEPSIFEEGLNPAGVGPRTALAAESIPVLDQVAGEVRACTKCGLCDTRTKAVPGVGTALAGIVFVGEAPGADEDRLGEPFVGRAGQLLDKIIKAMDEARLIPGVPLDRSTVFIANVLKCRPPENRNPLPHEIESCSPYLRRQLDVLKPRIICCLGKFAAELLVGAKGAVGAMRGKVYRYQGAKLIVTYHPAYCLRNPASKRPVWEDMQFLAREYLSD